MLPFFRKIRYRLAKDNQFLKYSRYAIGEIVLVVIGILIALAINNWNDKRKDRKNFDKILVEVEKELEFNIWISRWYINRFIRNDSIYQKLFIDSLKIENDYILNDILKYNPAWQTRRDSYEKLTQAINLNNKQDAILVELKFLYGVRRRYVEDIQNEYMQNRSENIDKIKNYDWYSNWLFNKLDDERIIDFFANNPEYIKMAMENFHFGSIYRIQLQRYDLNGVNAYRKIFSYLDSINLKHSDSLKYSYDPNDFKHFLGKYKWDWISASGDRIVPDDSIVVSLEEDKLIWTGYREVFPGTTRTEIIPFNKYSFGDDRGAGVYYLEFDDQGEVNGIRYSEGPSFILKTKKVR